MGGPITLRYCNIRQIVSCGRKDTHSFQAHAPGKGAVPQDQDLRIRECRLLLQRQEGDPEGRAEEGAGV